MQTEKADIFNEDSRDWRVIQRNADNAADYRIGGRFPVNAAQRDGDQFLARLVYENSGKPVADRFESMPVRMDGSGNWECFLEGVPAGGMYRFETRKHIEYGFQSEFPSVHHIGVGDLWIIAGQSNAGGFTGGYIEDAPEIGVHMFTWANRWRLASHPLGNGWGHSPFLYFGKTLKRTLGVPIGLIPLAIGGSPLCAWNPAEGEAPLYRRMMETLAVMKDSVKGMIWYQGCTDTNDDATASTYDSRFCDFAERLRQDLGREDLPVILVQLNRQRPVEPNAAHDRRWSIVREQQRIIPRKLAHAAVVPALDLSLSDGIHTSVEGNMVLGQRLADTALGMVYGADRTWKAPEIESAMGEDDGRSVRIRLKNISRNLVAVSGKVRDFTLEDRQGIVPVIRAMLVDNDSIRLELSRAIKDEAVLHGAYGADPHCDLRRNFDKMPMLGFYRFTVTRS